MDKVDFTKSLDDIISSVINESEQNNELTQTDSDKETSSEIKKEGSNIGNPLYDINIKTVFGSIASAASTTASVVYDYVTDLWNSTKSNYNELKENNSNQVDAGAWYNDFFTGANAGVEAISEVLDDVSNLLSQIGVLNNNQFGQSLVSIVRVMSQGLRTYQDGVSETSFGDFMAKSWQGNSNSFLDYFKNENMKSSGSYKINILNSTPLDSGETRNALFGSMILGTPYLFNNLADPNNRTLVNSFIKDGTILSLTPGIPKYYGSQYLQDDVNNIYKQTESPNDMLTYLLRNGIDRTFAEKDKRYYTFQAKYAEYFAYLETMLNPLWIKLGLANGDDDKTFNLFSFFKIKSDKAKDGSIDPSKYDSLLEQYNSSIGFFINPAGAVSESVGSSQTGFGGELGSEANSASDTYQRLNYITGMGTGGAVRNLNRTIATGLAAAEQFGNFFKDNLTTGLNNFSSAISSYGKTLKGFGVGLLGLVGGAAKDIYKIQTEKDLGSVIQSFATTNGMRVVYPELWQESSYSKNINFNMTFMSPYGDPLSIFKYVYVPFCALMCFALPRQAAENGFVSPFFVRADVPGLVTTDLGLISDITWTKGGSSNLWTKDGLPRAIDVTITLTDLYPYLAMTKRLSFLSANPSYTVFLDNMAGLCKLNDNTDEDYLNRYFQELINRVNGEEEKGNTLWNKYNSSKKKAVYNFGNSSRSAVSSYIDSVPWMTNTKN